MADKQISAMSDEEFLSFITSQEEDNSTEKTPEEETALVTDQEPETKADTEDDKMEADTLPENKEETAEENPFEDSSANNTQTSDEKHATDVKNDKNSDGEIDYKALYTQIMSPFKANGKTITPENSEDVISLMQMGANYVKKMSHIKPALKILKTMEKENITDEDIQLLIDIKKKDQTALKKLIKQQKIDPVDLSMSFDDNEVDSYKPKSRIISDAEFDYSEAVEELKQSPHYDKLYDIVMNKWDDKSKAMLLNDANLIKKLHEEIMLGRFDNMQEKVEKARAFGRYADKTDLDAYIDVVSNHVNSINSEASSKSKNTVYDKNKAKPTKASSTDSKISYTPKELLSMSDEDFLKLQKKGLF